MEFRRHFGYDVEAASNEAAIPPDGHGESLTVQSQSEDTDINVMMKRFGVTGRLPVSPRVPEFGDFSGVRDYQTALAAVMEAGEQFHEFPAEIRSRFGNDPQKMLEFCADAGNLDQAIGLGLITPERGEARRKELDVIQKRKDEEIVAAAKRLGLKVDSSQNA